MRSALLAALLALPAAARGGTLKLLAYDSQGKAVSLKDLLAMIGRADGSSAKAPIVASAPDGTFGQRPLLTQKGSLILLTFRQTPRVSLSLPWPVEGDGFSTVWLDHDGQGFSDGDVVYVNEEIALTQYRLFKEALARHTAESAPNYQPSSSARRLFDQAKDALAAAQASKDGSRRPQAFDAALRATALAWEKLLEEHGEQASRDRKLRESLRFGLTLDDSLLDRVAYHQWIVDKVRDSGANWVRLVFRPNPQDFSYSNISSFNEYDSIIKELRAKGIRVMGCVLDTNQWPSTVTPEAYALRTKNLVLHYSDQIRSWEVGLEINGDWLGGARQPLPAASVRKIMASAASQVKAVDPSLETVATLYWWDGTAPDYDHSLFGWLDRFGREALANVDVVGLSLQPEDNPVGLAFDTIFERTRQFLPDQKLMLSSFGFVEGSQLKGYWWLKPGAVDDAREDLLLLYTAAACSERRSLCGGFWWQTLDQMIPEKHRVTDEYRAFERTLAKLGR